METANEEAADAALRHAAKAEAYLAQCSTRRTPTEYEQLQLAGIVIDAFTEYSNVWPAPRGYHIRFRTMIFPTARELALAVIGLSEALSRARETSAQLQPEDDE